MMATISLPALNTAWVRALLALPSPYWVNKAWVRALLGKDNKGLTQALISSIRTG